MPNLSRCALHPPADRDAPVSIELTSRHWFQVAQARSVFFDFDLFFIVFIALVLRAHNEPQYLLTAL